jgi:hypothetical protein
MDGNRLRDPYAEESVSSVLQQFWTPEFDALITAEMDALGDVEIPEEYWPLSMDEDEDDDSEDEEVYCTM